MVITISSGDLMGLFLEEAMVVCNLTTNDNVIHLGKPQMKISGF